MNIAWAHKPSYGSNHTSASEAFEVIDPDISIVLYSEITCEADQVWMHLDSGDRDAVWVELGIPKLSRLEDYRPSLAVIAPGLPEAEVPFSIPDGMGAMVIETTDVDDPTFFYEEFTSTESWVLYSGWIDVPPDSDVYLVAWDPESYTGKLWVAVGQVEDFSDATVEDFVYWMDATQAFHEVDGPIKETEESCEPPVEEEATIDESSGCHQSSSSSSSFAWMSLVILACVRRGRGDQEDDSSSE